MLNYTGLENKNVLVVGLAKSGYEAATTSALVLAFKMFVFAAVTAAFTLSIAACLSS